MSEEATGSGTAGTTGEAPQDPAPTSSRGEGGATDEPSAPPATEPPESPQPPEQTQPPEETRPPEQTQPPEDTRPPEQTQPPEDTQPPEEPGSGESDEDRDEAGEQPERPSVVGSVTSLLDRVLR